MGKQIKINDSEWMEKFCGACFFRVNGQCRRNPPSVILYPILGFGSEYPKVQTLQNACYLWRQKNEE